MQAYLQLTLFGLVASGLVQASVLETGVTWTDVRLPPVIQFINDGYNEICDLANPTFSLGNAGKLNVDASNREWFSMVSVFYTLQAIGLLCVTLYLPNKFPVSAWQEWRAPKDELTSVVEDELAQVKDLTEKDQEFFLNGGKQMKKALLKRVLLRLPNLKEREQQLKWKRSAAQPVPELTAQDLADMVEELVKCLRKDKFFADHLKDQIPKDELGEDDEDDYDGLDHDLSHEAACDKWVWTEAGIASMTEQGASERFGNPKAGDQIPESSIAKLKEAPDGPKWFFEQGFVKLQEAPSWAQEKKFFKVTTTGDVQMTIVTIEPAELEVTEGTFNGEWHILQEDSLQFSDCEYKLSGIPTELVGCHYYRGPRHSSVMECMVETSGKVYVLAANGSTQEPNPVSKIELAYSYIKYEEKDMSTESFDEPGFSVFRDIIQDPATIWLKTVVFGACFEPRDPYRMLNFTLSTAYEGSLKYNEVETAKYVSNLMNLPATKMGVTLPWSEAMQLAIAAMGAAASAYLPVYSLVKGHFWKWFTPTYFVLTFRPGVLLGVAYGLTNGLVGIWAWDILTGNAKAFTKTGEFPFLRRSVGGPAKFFANIPLYGFYMQFAFQLAFIPAFIFWLVCGASLCLALTSCLLLILFILKSCILPKGRHSMTLTEPLLDAPDVRCNSSTTGTWKLLQTLKSTEREIYRRGKLWVVLLIVPSASIGAFFVCRLWLTLVYSWQPDTSSTYLCSYSRVSLVSLHLDSISGYLFLLGCLGAGMGLVLFLLQGTNLLKSWIDVDNHSMNMFIWEGVCMGADSVEMAIQDYTTMEMRSVGYRDEKGQLSFCRCWMAKVEKGLSFQQVPEAARKIKVVCHDAVQNNGRALEYVPKELKTEALCIEAVKQNSEAFKYVPEEVKTEVFCRQAVKQGGSALRFVSEEMKTEAVCLEAVKQDWTALEYVPKEMKTEAVCTEALKQSGFALRFVPDKMKTEAVCLEAVKQDWRALDFVPDKMKTEALCLEAVKQDGSALRFVPDEMKTEAFCTEVVKQDGRAIAFLPEDMKTEALWLEVVKQNGKAFTYVPGKMKTEAFCKEAMKQSGFALRFVPEEMKTEAVCLEAVKQDWRAFTYVPGEMKTEALCTEAVKQYGSTLDFVPEEMKIEAVCTEAVKQSVFALDFVPEEMKTEALCLAAVMQGGFALRFVPDEMKTEALCTEAVKQDGSALRFVPDEMKTEALCTELVKQDGSALRFVPDEMKTEALCLAAVMQDGRAFRFVPDKMKTEAFYTELVRQSEFAFRFVPDEMKTEAVCTELVKQDVSALDFVPDKMKTEALWLELVKQDGTALQYVPDKMKTEAVCTEAMKQDGSALRFVPGEMKTEAVCTEAVKQDGSALWFVPDKMKTEAVCTEAVKQDGSALDFVPDKMKTEAVCTEAVEQYWTALEYVPKEMKTEAVCTKALKQSEFALRFVPDEMKTEAFCTELVKQDGSTLDLVPEEMKTEAVCSEAVKQSVFALDLVPDEMKTEALCLEAVKQDFIAFRYVPEEMKTEAFCKELVKQSGFALQFVPDEMKTEALCTGAVKQEGFALQFVPEEMKTEAFCTELVKQDGRAFAFLPEEMKTEALCLEAVKQDWRAFTYVPEEMKTEAVCTEAVKQDRKAFQLVPEEMKTGCAWILESFRG